MKIKNAINSNKGVAVIFALGVFSLLSVLALGFVLTSNIGRKTSKSHHALKVSRMLAQSGLQRVMAGMGYYADDPSKDFSDILSHDPSATNSPMWWEDLPEIMPTTKDGITYYSWPSDYDPTDSDAVTWQYINDGDSSNKIIARLAYLVVPSKGKIDPSASIDSGVNAHDNSTNAISEDFPASEATSVDYAGNPIIGRPGRDASELFLATLPVVGQTDTASLLSADNIGGTPSGTLPYGELWPDLATLFGSLDITNDAAKTSFYDVFSIDNPKISEAFWIDTNSDSKKESSEFYHRFNLTRTDWDSLDLSDITASEVLWSTTPSSSGGILWLANWNSAGDMGSVENGKNQITANLLDYNDSDNIATTDENIASSAENFNPTYVGVEKCPYINEIKLIFAVKVDRQGKAGAKRDKRRKYRFRFRLQRVYLELVNMYGVDDDASQRKIADVYVDYEFKYDVDYRYLKRNKWSDEISSGEQSWGSSQLSKNIDYSEDGNDGYNDKNIVDYVYDYQNNFDGWTSYIDSADDINEDYSGLINISKLSAYVQINKIKIKLFNGDDTSKFYDFSFVADDTDLQAILEDYVPGNDYTKYLALDYEVNDPRQNLLTADWKLKTPTSTTTNLNTAYGLTFGSTIMQKNSNCDLPIPDDESHADSDPETATEPWNVSTAYIRNAPMQSPWEVGLIHRGATWQTINLKKYNSDDDIGTGGGGDYEKGDANILDQIKMTSDTETYGKICINSNIEDVLTVLFQKINVGSDITSSDGPGVLSGTEVDATDAGLLAEDVLANNGANSGTVFQTRAQLLRDTNGLTTALCYDGSVQGGTVSLGRTTDATQEELIGKFINLTTVDQSNVFTIIVVAQAINDIGDGITIRKDLNRDGDSADANETISNCQFGTYDQYADEVLAAQKIFTIVQRNPITGKFRILRYEYIDK